MDEKLIFEMKAIFADVAKTPASLEALGEAILGLAKIFSVNVKIEVQEPTNTRPYFLLRTSRSKQLPGEFTERHAVALENGGYRDTRTLSAPDMAVREKHYDQTGDLAIDIVANWKLRKDILDKLKLI